MGLGLTWTQTDVDYLNDKWAVLSIKAIAKHLGRSVNAIKIKAYKIGLGDPRMNYEGITVNQLAAALNKSYSSTKVWIAKYGMPAKKKIFCQESRVLVISYADFWRWGEQNKELLNFAKMDPLTLGPEPDWVKVKRQADQMRSQRTWQSTAWEKREDQILLQLVKIPGMTYPDLAKQLNRTESSIRRRLYDLNTKFRPERLENHCKYTHDQTNKLIEMAEAGYGYETIAAALGEGRSANGVRGKLERMKFDFKKRKMPEREVTVK